MPLTSAFHDQLSDLHDNGGEISTLSASQQALLDVIDSECPGPPYPPGPSVHTGFDTLDWKRLIRGPLAAPERISLITTIFSNRDEVKMVRRLYGDDAQTFVNVIYDTLDDLDQTPRMRCLRFLCKICGRDALLPKSLTIPLSCDRSKDPLCHGGFADVWKGVSRDLEVAVKVLKSYQCNQEQIRKGFCKEVVMWSALRHPNVLPLLGAVMDGARFTMVSEWMANGNINEFVKAHPDADRLELLGDVGRGLDYLHSQEMVHGDLKGANILINCNGHACIADFGLLTIAPDQSNFISSISHSEGGTTQWMSPELLDPEKFGLDDSRPTKKSDIYALGMVVYEVLSGQAPFPRCKEAVVIRKVMDGERPGRPHKTQVVLFTNDLWGMLERCWKPRPYDRPGLRTVLQCLEGVAQRVAGTVSISPKTSNMKQPDTGGSDLDDQPLPRSDRTVVPLTPRATFLPAPKILDIILSFTNAKQLEAGDFDLDELVERLTEVLIDGSQWGEILHLTGDNAVLAIECLDKVVSSDAFRTNSDTLTRSRAFSAISRLSRGCRYLPRSYWIEENTIILPNEPYTYGRWADVYHGAQSGEPVAVKVSRIPNQENPTKLKKRFCNEAIVWKHMVCPYILKFNGAFYHNGVPAIVTPWVPHGNITDYLEKHSDADRLRLLLGVVKGVRYLHNYNIAHGGIEAPNILVSDLTPPRAMLTDFGSIRVTTTPVEMSSEEQGTASFMAPELLLPADFGLDKGIPSKEADVYALGMTVYQVLTDKWPFFPRREAEVIHAVISGERPPKPENGEEIGMTEVLWDLLRGCWKEDRTARPTIAEVVKRFCEITSSGKTTDSALEGFPAPRLDVGKRGSGTSQNSTSTTDLSPYGLDVAAITAPPNSYDPGEVSDTEGKNTEDDNTTKTNFLTIKGVLGVKTRDTGKSSTASLTSPTDSPVHLAHESRVEKRKHVWGRFKQAIRSASQ